MKKLRRPRRIPALFWTATLLACLALSACGDATSTNIPAPTGHPLKPFSPVAFSQDTSAATTPPVTTAATTSAVTTSVLTTSVATTSAVTTTTTTSLATTAVQTTTPAGSIRNNWLRGVPCKAPCWENITPGKTTPHDAIEILKNIPEFTNPQPVFVGANSYDLHGTDSTTGEPVAIFNLFAFHSKPEPAHVEIIKPEVQTYKLKDAFATYGEPSHIIAVYAFQEGMQPQPYSLYLIYMSQGLILSNNIKGDEPTLTPETVFNGGYFFIPGQQGFNLVNGQGDIRADVMVEWQGYKDFKFYCRRGSKETGIKGCN